MSAEDGWRHRVADLEAQVEVLRADRDLYKREYVRATKSFIDAESEVTQLKEQVAEAEAATKRLQWDKDYLIADDKRRTKYIDELASKELAAQEKSGRASRRAEKAEAGLAEAYEKAAKVVEGWDLKMKFWGGLATSPPEYMGETDFGANIAAAIRALAKYRAPPEHSEKDVFVRIDKALDKLGFSELKIRPEHSPEGEK